MLKGFLFFVFVCFFVLVVLVAVGLLAVDPELFKGMKF